MVVPLLISMLLGFGCDRPVAPTGPRWIDVIAENTQDDETPVFFHDQTFVASTLNDVTAAFSADVDLNHPTSITIGGGLRNNGDQKDASVEVSCQLTMENGFAVASSTRATPPWWGTTLELPEGLVGHGSLSISATLSDSQELILRRILVQQEVPAPTTDPPAPQILLISLDTLREDALGFHGGPWQTPNLDEFAQAYETWSPHYSGGGWTKPSHATMLTGYRGDTHQMSDLERVLNPGIQTVAQRLSGAGIATGASVFDCKWLDPKWGFDRGFDEYRVTNWRIGRSVRQVANWVVAHQDEPFFFFYHTFEPHSDWHRLPYESPGTTQQEIDQLYDVDGYGCEDGRCASQRLNDINDGVTQLLDNEVEILRQLYGRGVQETDRALGDLFQDLKTMGVWDNLLIVITSDHGEAFMEHGRLLHGLTWAEIVRVPLLVKWPAGIGQHRIGEFASGSADLVPTILHHAGLEWQGLPGTPLQTLDHERPIVIGGPNRMVAHGGWKANIAGNARDLRFLSRIDTDPRETRNLSSEHPDQAQALLKIAQQTAAEDIDLRHRLEDSDVNTETLSAEEREKLRALGYLE
jgi:arylsulfatase A-like enzyme